jgi:hypothetical protein
VNVSVPIAELVLEQIDARSGLNRLADCIPMLEQAFASWQDNGGAANFELLVAAERRAQPLSSRLTAGPS